MKKFIIEREVPGAGNMTQEELRAVSQASMAAVAVLGKPYKWVESYVTADKIYCVHEADTEDTIRQHSSCANIPVSKVEEVKTMIWPATAEE